MCCYVGYCGEVNIGYNMGIKYHEAFCGGIDMVFNMELWSINILFNMGCRGGDNIMFCVGDAGI